MIVVSEAERHIRNKAQFAKMTHPNKPKLVIYFLKYAWRDGFEIPNRVGRCLEKRGHVPADWGWDP